MASVLAGAFDRDPLARWLFPEAGTRRVRHGQLFAQQLAASPLHATVEVTGDLDAVAIWYPPGQELQLVPSPEATSAARAFFEAVSTAAPPGPFWYLAFLGARTGGTGGGSTLMRHRLDRISETAALWTANHANLGFYARCGFAVVSEHRVAGASAWWMTRRA